MKTILLSIATLAMCVGFGTAWGGDAAEMSEICIDCHDVEEFEGMDAGTIVSKTAEANADNKKMAKATADISAEDLQKIAEYLAAEAAK